MPTRTVYSWSWATAGTLVAYFVCVGWLFSWTRRELPEAFRAMGEPGFISNNNLRSNWRMCKFLFGFQYLQYSSTKLNLLCIATKVSLLAGMYLIFTRPLYFSISSTPN